MTRSMLKAGMFMAAAVAACVAVCDEDGSQVLHPYKPPVKGDPVERWPVACTAAATVVGEAPSLYHISLALNRLHHQEYLFL